VALWIGWNAVIAKAAERCENATFDLVRVLCPPCQNLRAGMQTVEQMH
jgi:hypothetical protein